METADPSRHSKTKPEPVTIDLGPEAVKDIEASEAEGTQEDATASTAAEPSPAAGESTADEPAADFDPAMASKAQPPKARQSGLSLIAASLIGGVVALGGAAGLQYWGVLPALGGNETKATLNALSSDIEALKSKLAAVEAAEPQIDLGPINQKIATLEEKAATMPLANGLSADADARISALGESIAAAEAKIAATGTDGETARAALEMRLEALEKKANAPRDDVEVAVAIAAAGLKAAIDRGGPFMAELDTLAGIKPDDPAVAELKAYSATGVPSRAELVKQFPAIASTMMSALVPVDPDQSLTDRLLESAFSAIKVRPVGNVEGEGPEAIVARMEQKLQNGDLKGAALEWGGLPEGAKAASSAYKKALDARIRVEELVGATLSKAVHTTGDNG